MARWKWVLDELAGRHIGKIHISTRDALAANIKFADLADSDLLQVFINDMADIARQRVADRHNLTGNAIAQGGDDGRLGRAVSVQHAARRRRPFFDKKRPGTLPRRERGS